MKQRADSEKLMIRYLLGDVPEDEQIRIEERFFTDDEYFEQLLALEDDLIDDYVNGELTDRERKQFEEYFLASPTRRQRVEFAKTFMRAGSLPALAEIAMPGEARPEPVPWWRNVMVFWRAQGPLRRFALAASVVLALGGSWLIVDTMRLRNQVEQLQAERGESQRREQELLQHIARLSQESERVTELSTQLERERSERVRLEQNFQQHIAEQRQRSEELAQLLGFLGGVKGSPSQHDRLRFESRPALQRLQLSPHGDSLAFELFPGRTRDIEGTNRFVIPQDVDSMQLRLYLPAVAAGVTDPPSRYRAVVRTAEGNEVWSQDGLEAQRTGLREEAIVILDLPTHILPEGDYIITLSRRSASGDFEDVGSYQFSVVRK
jgi:anti-sigma factor RsiW